MVISVCLTHTLCHNTVTLCHNTVRLCHNTVTSICFSISNIVDMYKVFGGSQNEYALYKQVNIDNCGRPLKSVGNKIILSSSEDLPFNRAYPP